MSTSLESNYTFALSRIEGVIYAAQTVELPAITMTERNVNARLVDYGQPGEKLIFDKLNIQFIVDENLDNYMELVDWMWQCVNPNKGTWKNDSSMLSDGVLTAYNKHKKPTKHFRFHSCFPSIVGPLMYSNAGTDNRHMTCNVTLSYTYWHCEESKVAEITING